MPWRRPHLQQGFCLAPCQTGSTGFHSGGEADVTSRTSICAPDFFQKTQGSFLGSLDMMKQCKTCMEQTPKMPVLPVGDNPKESSSKKKKNTQTSHIKHLWVCNPNNQAGGCSFRVSWSDELWFFEANSTWKNCQIFAEMPSFPCCALATTADGRSMWHEVHTIIQLLAPFWSLVTTVQPLSNLLHPTRLFPFAVNLLVVKQPIQMSLSQVSELRSWIAICHLKLVSHELITAPQRSALLSRCFSSYMAIKLLLPQAKNIRTYPSDKWNTNFGSFWI